MPATRRPQLAPATAKNLRCMQDLP